MRKIKYKKGRKIQPYNLEYTGIHKKTDSEMPEYPPKLMTALHDFRYSR